MIPQEINFDAVFICCAKGEIVSTRRMTVKKQSELSLKPFSLSIVLPTYIHIHVYIHLLFSVSDP